jgi:hypothetical protein
VLAIEISRAILMVTDRRPLHPHGPGGVSSRGSHVTN